MLIYDKEPESIPIWIIKSGFIRRLERYLQVNPLNPFYWLNKYTINGTINMISNTGTFK